MIRHCVHLKFTAKTEAAKRSELLGRLAALADEIEGMSGVMMGQNASPEGLSQGFDDVFLCDFADAAARDTYLKHPKHLATVGELVPALEGGPAGAVVVDVEG